MPRGKQANILDLFDDLPKVFSPQVRAHLNIEKGIFEIMTYLGIIDYTLQRRPGLGVWRQLVVFSARNNQIRTHLGIDTLSIDLR